MARPVRLEALMRWFDPDRGQVSPAHFIPIAEEIGPHARTWPLGFRHSRRTRQGTSRNDQDSLSTCRPYSSGPRGSSRRSRTCWQHRARPIATRAGVTETAIMSSLTTAGQVIQPAPPLGIHIALDDFGTGYSSLSYLQRFAFNTVKIDRSFVAGMQKASQYGRHPRGAVDRARSRHRCRGRGCGDEAQRDALVREGCGFLQGYLFGTPRSLCRHRQRSRLRQLHRTAAGIAARQEAAENWLTTHNCLCKACPSPQISYVIST